MFLKVLVLSILSFSAFSQSLPEQVLIQTTHGDMKIELDKKTPITVNNFYKYVTDGFYNGQVIHRVVKDFVIQAGSFKLHMQYVPATYPPIVNEAKLADSNLKGTIAMARTKEPDSARTNFFINLANNTRLDYDPKNNKAGYAVFGRVIEGIDILEKIGSVATTEKIFIYNGKEYTRKDVPVIPVIILSMQVL